MRFEPLGVGGIPRVGGGGVRLASGEQVEIGFYGTPGAMVLCRDGKPLLTANGEQVGQMGVVKRGGSDEVETPQGGGVEVIIMSPFE